MPAAKTSTTWKRFDARVAPPNERGCTLWTGGTTKGYGQLRVDGRTVQVHRLAWMRVHGPVPDGLFVLHECDTPLCVNPEHLFLGTQADNMDDMTAKGRRPRGERHGCAKLTAADVLAIRASRKGDATLPARFGITRFAIYRIRHGLTWRHL